MPTTARPAAASAPATSSPPGPSPITTTSTSMTPSCVNGPPVPRRAGRSAGAPSRRTDGSAQLLDADQVARGVAEGAVAHAVRLVDRLLDDLGPTGLHLLEGVVEIRGGQQDPPVGALGHHLGDR